MITPGGLFVSTTLVMGGMRLRTLLSMAVLLVMNEEPLGMFSDALNLSYVLRSIMCLTFDELAKHHSSESIDQCPQFLGMCCHLTLP